MTFKGWLEALFFLKKHFQPEGRAHQLFTQAKVIVHARQDFDYFLVAGNYTGDEVNDKRVHEHFLQSVA